ncbi:MAG: phage terminase large subunit [Rhodospirillaceae bacterium]|nr:phage terminase large subunit [Rhodospirillaceae bacterium]
MALPTLHAFVEAWNKDQNLTTPDLHEAILDWLLENWKGNVRALLLMAFRNSGKSTLVGLFCAWLLKCDPNLRIIVLAADLALARKMVRNVKRIVERHPQCDGMKPKRIDQWASDQFTVNRSAELRDPSMLARGIGANVTGSRADVFICDDVEVPNTCNTAPKRADLRSPLDEIAYVLVPGGLQLYVGTPHTFYSIYSDNPEVETTDDADTEMRPYLDGFKRLELALLNEKGLSRWPERFSENKIDEIKKRTGPNKFASQMMLRPVSIAEGRLEPDRLILYETELDYREGNDEAILMLGARRLVSASCWWDPAYGSPQKGDASVIAAVFTDDQGDYWLHRVQYLEHDPALNESQAEAVQLCRKVARFMKDTYQPSVTIENNGIGKFLAGLLRHELREDGLDAAVLEKASSRSKDQRIIDAFDAVLAAGRLHAHASVWQTPFIAEMREWRPGTNGRDDGLDAVSGCLLSEPVRLPRRPAASSKDLKARSNWRGNPGGFKAHTTFKV